MIFLGRTWVNICIVGIETVGGNIFAFVYTKKTRIGLKQSNPTEKTINL